MELNRYKKQNQKTVGIILFTLACVFLIVGVILYQTYAIYEVLNDKDLLNGNVGDPGDIYFAFYKDGVIQKDIPKKEEGYVLDEKQSYCSVNGRNDDDITVSITDDYTILVHGVKTSRTKCNLYFVRGKFIQGRGIPLVSNGVGLYEIEHKNISNTLNNDGFSQTEYRYVGSNPNNYIWFNNELWRIIGLVNVMINDTTVDQRLKIIRNESLGNYSWDTSTLNVNTTRGINEWSQADLNILLNDYYLNRKDNQQCFIHIYDTTRDCSFSSTGILDDFRSYIENVTWNVGALDSSTIYLDNFYIDERSTKIGKICDSNSINCNDNISRTYKWSGKIALAYPSDYAYSVENAISNCSNVPVRNWNTSQDECNSQKSWFFGNMRWLLSPYADPEKAHICIFVGNLLSTANCYYGESTNENVYMNTFPTLYLKQNVKIVNDEQDGSIDKPYHLQQIL